MNLDIGLEGWIGGLVAAALTLAFTAWWDTRQHRRRQLDDAITALVSAVEEGWDQLLKVKERGAPLQTMEQHIHRIGTANIRLTAVAGRRILRVQPRWTSPCRSGLERTMATVYQTWSYDMQHLPGDVALERLDRASRSTLLEPVEDAQLAIAAVGMSWLHDPWRFAWNRDLAGEFLEQGPVSPDAVAQAPDAM